MYPIQQFDNIIFDLLMYNSVQLKRTDIFAKISILTCWDLEGARGQVRLRPSLGKFESLNRYWYIACMVFLLSDSNYYSPQRAEVVNFQSKVLSKLNRGRSVSCRQITVMIERSIIFRENIPSKPRCTNPISLSYWSCVDVSILTCDWIFSKFCYFFLSEKPSHLTVIADNEEKTSLYF